MALGTTTLLKKAGQEAALTVFIDTLSVVLDNSYPTGGYGGLPAKYLAAVNASLGGSHNRAIVAVLGVDTKGYTVGWDEANEKLLIYYGDNDNGADGPGVEVTNGGDLHLVTLKLLILAK